MTEGFVFSSESEAQAACEWWQKELRLQDWDIKCWIRRQHDMDPNADGEFNLTKEHKQGWIKLLDSVDYSPNTSWPQDHERTLVHELLHYHMTSISVEEGALQEVAKEQMIELTAGALVNLRRLAYPESPWREEKVNE